MAEHTSAAAGVSYLDRTWTKTAINAALSIAPLGAVAGTGLLGLGPLPRLILFGIAGCTSGLLLWRIAWADALGITRAQAMFILVIPMVLPELAVDLRFAWQEAGIGPLAGGPLTLTSMTGASRLLVGLAWPLAILVGRAKGAGGDLKLLPGHRILLSFLMLAALYTFTIYLKGFVSVLDTVFLGLLFAGLAWTMARRPAGVGDSIPLPKTAVKPNARGGRTAVVFAIPALAAATALAATGLADAASDLAMSVGTDRFGLVQWLVPVGTKLSLLVGVVALVWRGRAGDAASTLISTHIGHVTILLALLPVAVLTHGLVLGGDISLALDARQRSELLLTSAQVLCMVLMLANLTPPLRSAVALLALFMMQLAVGYLHPAGQTPEVQTLLAAVYLGVSMWIVTRHRGGLEAFASTLRLGHRKSTGTRGLSQSART